MQEKGALRFIVYIMLYPAIISSWGCSAAGGANAESRRRDRRQLPLLSGRKGPQQELQDVAQGFLSLRVAYSEHGGKVRADVHEHRFIF